MLYSWVDVQETTLYKLRDTKDRTISSFYYFVFFSASLPYFGLVFLFFTKIISKLFRTGTWQIITSSDQRNKTKTIL